MQAKPRLQVDQDRTPQHPRPVVPVEGQWIRNEYLLASELHQLSGYARHGQQHEWLTAQGIPHRVDGKRIIVSREHVRAWLEGRATVMSTGLNLKAIR